MGVLDLHVTYNSYDCKSLTRTWEKPKPRLRELNWLEQDGDVAEIELN
jgi:hypothetical protein